MPVRKTESRLPLGFTAADLGQSATAAANANIHLVAYLTGSVVRQRKQNYVVFVTDAAVAATVGQYEWTITNVNPAPAQTTNEGVLEFIPQHLGALRISVRILNTGGIEIATVQLDQTVIALNQELENLIDRPARGFPAAANPDTSREVVNDLRRYVDDLIPPATDDIFNRLVLCWIYAQTLSVAQAARHTRINDLAALLNGATPDAFASAAQTGFGIGRLRPHVLAMFLPGAPAGTTLLPIRDFAANARTRTGEVTAFLGTFNTDLSLDLRIDLFNRIRFPKTSVQAVKLLLEGLRDRFEAGMTMQELFNTPDRLRVLITELETGPVAGLAASRSSGQVLALMPHLVWQIAPVGGAGSSPGIGATYRIGEPEDIPIPPVLYLVAGTGSPFTETVQYHANYGITAVRFNSIQHLVELLAADNFTIRRLRVIAHANDQGLGAEVFTGDGAAFASVQEFEGYGESDIRGLEATLGHAHLGAYLGNIMTALRTPARRAVLVPFGLEISGLPVGDVLEYFRYCNDLNFIRLADIQRDGVTVGAGSADRTNLRAAFRYMAAEMAGRITSAVGANITNAQLTTLQTTIEALTLADTNHVSVGSQDFAGQTLNLLPATVAALQGGFRTRLNSVKARFNADSFIDVRGCNFGRLPNSLAALGKFFGRTGQEPHVTAPQWSQSFQQMGSFPLHSNAEIDTVLTAGTTAGSDAFTAATITTAVADWIAMAGSDPQLAYLRTQFALSDFDFFLMEWTVNIPNLNLPARQIEELAALAYPEKIIRLGAIFGVDAAAGLPGTATRTSLGAMVAPAIRLKNMEARLNAAPAPAEFPAIFTEIQQQIATPLGQAALLPATAPAGLNLPTLQGYVQALKTYITGRLTAIPTFKTALQTQSAAANASTYYYLRIGLPLIVPLMAPPDLNGDIFPLTYYIFYFQPLSAQAMRSFMRSQWEGIMPASNLIDTYSTSDADARRISTVERHSDPNDHLSPIVERHPAPLLTYDAHIGKHP